MSKIQQIQTTIGALRLALQMVVKTVDTRQVTFQFKNDQMFVHACLGNAHAVALVPTTGSLDDAVLPLTGKTLLAILHGCESEAVCTLTKSERGLRMNFGGAKVTLDRFSDPDVEFFARAVETRPSIDVGTFKASEFREALQSVVRFASRDDLRLFMRGVFLQVINGKLVLAATDGFRLAEKKSLLECADMPSAILPASYADALCSILKDEDTVQLMSIGKADTHNLLFKTPTFSLKCPVICGSYPDYKRVIPELPFSVELDTRMLASAAERMAILSGRYVRMAFKDAEIVVLTEDRESQEKIGTQGDRCTLDVSLQAKLLTDSLAAVKTPSVSISVDPEQASQSRLLLKNVGEEDGWLAVVMPATI